MATRESYQKIRLSLNISWEPGSQVPREFVALYALRAAAVKITFGENMMGNGGYFWKFLNDFHKKTYSNGPYVT